MAHWGRHVNGWIDVGWGRVCDGLRYSGDRSLTMSPLIALSFIINLYLFIYYYAIIYGYHSYPGLEIP